MMPARNGFCRVVREADRIPRETTTIFRPRTDPSSAREARGGTAIVGVNGNIFVKPGCTSSSSATNDSIQYVSPNGNDGNDGCSWGSAKKTWLGAYNSLPGKGGTVYFTGDSNNTGSTVASVNATPVSGQGIGFAGTNDPNFGSMPMVINNVQWVAYTKHVSFVGVPSNTTGTSLNSPAACVLAGNNTTDAIMLSGSSIGIGFFNVIECQSAKRGLVIGENSNGVRSYPAGGGAWSGLNVENSTFFEALEPPQLPIHRKWHVSNLLKGFLG